MRTLMQNVAKGKKEPKMTNAAKCLNGCLYTQVKVARRRLCGETG